MSPIPANIWLVLSVSEEKLESAKILLNAGQWRDAASRAYYCAFHAACAVLLTRGLTYSSHAQTIGAFNREFVKSGLFPGQFGRRLMKLQTDREAADYRFASPFDEMVAREDVLAAEEFLSACRSYLEEHYSSN